MPREWTQYAHKQERHDGVGYAYTDIYPNIRSLTLYSGIPANEVVPVRLAEDASGEYQGFLFKGKPEELELVQHHRIFPVQFAYGLKEAYRDGEIVQLRLEEVN